MKFPKTVNTLPLNKSPIGDESYVCEIIDVKLVDPGLFRSNYLSFTIKTIPKKWIVQRKYSNFIELRNAFTKFYPGFIIPPLPNPSKKKAEEENQDKKKYCLEIFLNDILMHPVLLTSKLFYYFLSLNSEQEFESKLSEVVKIPPPKLFKEFQTPSSQALVNQETPLKDYCNGLIVGTNKLKQYHTE